MSLQELLIMNRDFLDLINRIQDKEVGETVDVKEDEIKQLYEFTTGRKCEPNDYKMLDFSSLAWRGRKLKLVG